MQIYTIYDTIISIMVSTIEKLDAATGNETSPSDGSDYEPEFRYRLLRGHRRTNGTFKDDETLRAEYVHLTDELIYKMTGGEVEFRSLSGDVVKDARPDYVIWLDKSARPVAWLTKELWPQLASDSDGSIPEMPEFRFVNIDREQWAPTLDPLHTGFMDYSAVPQNITRSLRSIFIRPELKRDGITDAIDDTPSELDGKNVLIIDEVRASGRTLEMAKAFFKRAFPSSYVSGAHWMSRTVSNTDGSGNADLPVWYKSDTPYGRGVGNRDTDKSLRSPSLGQRLGAWFLSTALDGGDEDSITLREEMKHLSDDVSEGEILVIPSFDRPDYFDRAERLNNTTRQEFEQKKKSLGDF